MSCNDKMGNSVRGFPAYMGWYWGECGEREMRGLEGREKPLVCF